MIMENIDKVHDNKAMAKILNYFLHLHLQSKIQSPKSSFSDKQGNILQRIDIKVKVKALFQEVNIFPSAEA